MIEVTRVLARHGVVIVKEHPAFYGYRSPAFYRRLRAVNGVVLVPPDVASLSLVERADQVVVVTGTTGFEAALRGKPVITLGMPYYASGRFFRDVPSLDQLTAAVVAAQEPQSPITLAEQQAMIAKVVAGCLPGRVRADRSFNSENPEHRNEIGTTAASLRAYLAGSPAQKVA